MMTPPTDKGKGKQLLYSREHSPQLPPLQRPRYTSSPQTAVIQPGDSTPSPISPNITDDFAITSSPSMRRTLSSESSKLRMEIEPIPEQLTKTEPSPTPTPSSQEAVRVELAALIKSEDKLRRSTPLDQYWIEDQQRRMFHAEPTPKPTEPRSTKSPYEQKFMITRPSTPIKDEPTLSPALTPKPKPSQLLPLTDTMSPSVSKTLAWGLPTRDQVGTAPVAIQRKFQIPKRSLSPPLPRGPSPPCPPTPPLPPSRGPSPRPLQNLNPVQGSEESLQGKEPFVFDRN